MYLSCTSWSDSLGNGSMGKDRIGYKPARTATTSNSQKGNKDPRSWCVDCLHVDSLEFSCQDWVENPYLILVSHKRCRGQISLLTMNSNEWKGQTRQENFTLPFDNTLHDCAPQSIFQPYPHYITHHGRTRLRVVYHFAGLSSQDLHLVSATRTFLLTRTHDKSHRSSHSYGCGYDPGSRDYRDACVHPMPLGLYCINIGWWSSGHGLMEGRKLVSRIRSSWSGGKIHGTMARSIQRNEICHSLFILTNPLCCPGPQNLETACRLKGGIFRFNTAFRGQDA